MIELNQVYLGDCLELLNKVGNSSIDMVLVDLPFGVTSRNDWDKIIPMNKLWAHYERICKPNAAVVLNSMQPFTSFLISSNLKQFKYCLYWNKKMPSGFLNAKKQPLRCMEDICVFYKSQPTYNPQMEIRGKVRNKGGYNKGTGSSNYGEFGNVKAENNEYYPTNYLEFSNANQKEKKHPTAKPISLCEYLIKTYSNEGNVVLDHCAGSGSTLVAAQNLKRNFIGIEKDEVYFEVAKSRLKQ